MNVEQVAVIGASSKPNRYSYKAIALLKEHNHIPIPVSMRDDEILGFKAYRSIEDIPTQIDTVTLYINPKVLAEIIDDIIAKAPKRVIMNPGTESESAKELFRKHNIRVIEACTLVLLKTNQFMSV